MVSSKCLGLTLFMFGCVNADTQTYSDNLKSCLEVPNHICLTGNGSYSRPSSVLVETQLEFAQIIEIDVEKNSIKFQGELGAIWEDPGLATSPKGSAFMIGEDWESLLWRPWLKFENLLSFEKTEFFGGTKSSSFWNFQKPKKDGSKMFYAEEFKLTFSCNFSFIDYPFDSHECALMYSDKTAGLNNVTITSPEISFGNILHKEGDEPIILDHLPFPFELKLKSLPTSTATDSWGFSTSRTGMLFKMKRNDFGKLLASYYYPMASFAVLSLISFLINPDIVSYSYCGFSFGT